MVETDSAKANSELLILWGQFLDNFSWAFAELAGRLYSSSAAAANNWQASRGSTSAARLADTSLLVQFPAPVCLGRGGAGLQRDVRRQPTESANKGPSYLCATLRRVNSREDGEQPEARAPVAPPPSQRAPTRCTTLRRRRHNSTPLSHLLLLQRLIAI